MRRGEGQKHQESQDCFTHKKKKICHGFNKLNNMRVQETRATQDYMNSGVTVSQSVIIMNYIYKHPKINE